MRYVLVITGKGSSSGGDGVLRRAVPAWLATPPFRAWSPATTTPPATMAAPARFMCAAAGAP